MADYHTQEENQQDQRPSLRLELEEVLQPELEAVNTTKLPGQRGIA